MSSNIIKSRPSFCAAIVKEILVLVDGSSNFMTECPFILYFSPFWIFNVVSRIVKALVLSMFLKSSK